MNVRVLAAMTVALAAACSGAKPGGTGGGSNGGGSGGGGGSAGMGGGPGGGSGGMGATLSSLAISPGTVMLAATETQQLTARGTYSDGSTRDVTTVAMWSSSADNVARVSAGGLVTAAADGSATVTATLDGKMGTVPLTVSGQALTTLEVGPPNLDMGVGATVQYYANGTFADGSKRSVASEVTWASSMGAVASVSSTGVVTALSAGTTAVSVSLRGKSAMVNAAVGPKTVTAIAVAPPALTLAQGETKAMAATATYSDGSTGDVTAAATWSVDPGSTSNVSVSATGVVMAVAPQPGNAVRATLQGVSGLSRVTVTTTQNAITRLLFRPEDVVKGLIHPPQRVTAELASGLGTSFSFVTWSSSDPNVLRLEPGVGWNALQVGSVTMTAVLATATGMLMTSGVVNVTEPIPDSITVSSGAAGVATLAQGATLKLVATGVSLLFPALNADLSNRVTWASNNPAAVTVDATGLARGVGPGSATITATLGATVGSTMLTVPTSAPPMMSTVLVASEDNSIFSSSITANSETRVYPTNAFFSDPGIGVGCMWLWNPPIGPAPEQFHATCAEGLIKFDLSSLAGKTILSAKLRLTTSAYGIGSVPRRWYLTAVARTWSGSSVTWAQASSFGYYVASASLHDPPNQVGQVYEIDQTATVKNWISGAYVNGGFRMNINSYLYPYLRYNSLDPFEFYSREDVAGRGPKLLVTYQ